MYVTCKNCKQLLTLQPQSQWPDLRLTAARYELDNGMRLFVKLSTSGDETMFKGEALGLQAMYGARVFNLFCDRGAGSKVLDTL